MTLLGAGDDGGLLLCQSVHGCCVNWSYVNVNVSNSYASPGLPFR